MLMEKMARNPVSDVDFVSYTGRRKKDSIFSIGKRWKIWKGIIAFSTFLSMVLSSFLATFDTSFVSMVAILYVCDAFYLVDTAIRIRNCYLAAKKEKLSSSMTFKLFFPIVIDVFSLLPLEVFAITKIATNRPWLHVSRLHRLNRAIRFYKLFSYCRELEDEQGANFILIRTIKHVFVTYAALHLIACGWYSLGCEPSGVPDAKCSDKGWALSGDTRANPEGHGKHEEGEEHGEEGGHGEEEGHGEEGGEEGEEHHEEGEEEAEEEGEEHHEEGEEEGEEGEEHHEDPEEHLQETGEHISKIPTGIPIPQMSTFDRYLVCLYWSTITATSTGYGDVHAVDDFEKLYSILCMMVGVVFFFGTILGDMGSTITNTDKKRAVYKHKFDAVVDYMHQKDIKDDTENIVHGFFQYMWGVSGVAGKKEVFRELPITLQAELSLNVNSHILEKVPLFKDTSDGFKRMLSMNIKQTTYFPDQLLFRENDIGHSLYYVRRGEVKIFKGDDETPLKTFTEGSYFGEIALVINVPRSASARAVSYSDILSLDRSALNSVIRHFPNEYAVLQSAIQERYQKAEMNKDSTAASYGKDIENLEGNKMQEGHTNIRRMNLKQLYNDFVISPSSSFYNKWRMLVFAMSLFFVVAHTSIASFKVSFGDHGYGDGPVLLTVYSLMYLYDLILVCDILIYLRTSIDNPEKGIVKDPKKIRQLQMKTWKFWLDVASVLPFELFAPCFSSQLYRWYAATFLRSNRLLRIYHIPHFFDMLEMNINISVSKVKPCKLILYIFLTTHLTSCVWFLQACAGTSCAEDSWAYKFGINETNSEWFNYLVSVYWSCATMTSTGYGDISAMSRRDEVVVLAVLIIGLLLYGYCVCSICSTLIHQLAPRNHFMEHFEAVKKYLKELDLSSELITEVNSYLKLVWQMHKGQSLPGTSTLINDMPQTLQENIAYEQLKDILQDVPIFRDTDERFQKLISLHAKTFLYMPGDTIVHIGDLSRDLYIVRRGQAEVLSSDRSCVVATFGPGGYFGEVGLLYGESRPSDVRAKTYCEVVVISKKDMDEILPRFPVIAKQLEHISENIGVLQKLQATAHEQANRSAIAQKTVGENQEVKQRNVDNRKKGGMRKVSLPSKIDFSSTDKNFSITPEYRQERIEVLQKVEQQEYYSMLNPITKILSKILMTQSISPHNQYLKKWTLLTSIVAYFYLILVGIHISFVPETLSVQIVGYLLDFFFLIDIYIKMHVGFYNEKGILITCTLKTAEEYIKTSFIFDLIAVIPFDAIFISYHEAAHYGKINRIFHFLKLVQFFSYFHSSIGFKSDLIRLFGMNSYLLLMTHYFACAWFYFACSSLRDHYHYVDDHHEENGTEVDTGIGGTELDFHHRHFMCGVQSWAGRMTRADIQHEDMHFQYVASLYWTVSTLCSVGYGDIHAYLPAEMFLSAVCMVFGVVYFGYIIAFVSASISSVNALRSDYQDDINGLRVFLENQKVESSLKSRVMDHFNHVWQRTKGIEIKSLFQGFPHSLKETICFELYQSMLLSVPVFKSAPTGFIKLLARHIRPIYILNDELIVKKGDIASQIFFLYHGNAEIITEGDESTVVREFGPGNFFGDIGVICNSPVYSSIRSKTNADFFIITKKDLDMILETFPQVKKNVVEAAEEIKVEMDEKEKNGMFGFDVQRYKKETVIMIEDKPNEGKSSINDLSVKFTAANGNENEATSTITKYKADSSETPQGADGSQPKQAGLIATLKQWNRFVIKKDNPLRHVRTINGVGMYMTYLTITFMATFHEYSTSFFVFSYLWEASFLFEMYLNFHMYYTLENQDVIEDYDMTFNHYLNGELFFDVFANCPLELLCFAFPRDRRLEILCFLRFIHILRLRRVHKLFEYWLSKLNINVFLVTLSQNILEAFVIIHGFSCIWYLMACTGLECSDNSWIAELHTHADPFSRYFDCFYWAVATMTSTGYGDIHATNAAEMIFCAIVMIAGRLVFGFVLGKVTSTLATTESHRVNFEEKVKDVKAHMSAQHIKPSLQSRVLDFFRESWLKNKGVDVSALLLKTPFCLRAELYVSLIGDIIRCVPMFEKCSESVIRHLCCQANYSHMCAGEFVTREGDVDENLYLIKSGEVEGIIEETNGSSQSIQSVTTYKEGSFFGDGNVLSGKPSKISIRTKTDVDLFVLKKSCVFRTLQIFKLEVPLAALNVNCSRRLSVVDEE